MIIISHLPDSISSSLNVLDSDQVINAAIAYRIDATPSASVATTSLEDAYRLTSDKGSLPNAGCSGNLRRATTVGDILSQDGTDYVVLAFGFHKLCPHRWK